MYKECQTPNSRKRQQHIAHTLVEMLAEKSFREVQISELCRQADIPRKAFYRYFDTKEDVIVYLAESALAESSIDGDFMDHQLTASDGQIIGVHIFEYWKDHAELFNALTDQDSLGVFQTTYMEMILSRQLGLSRICANHESKRAVALFAASGFLGLLLLWKHSDFSRTAEDMGRMFAQMLTTPLYE